MITQSSEAGGWYMEEVYLWLADAVTFVPFHPALFRCVSDLAHYSVMINFGFLYSQWKQATVDITQVSWTEQILMTKHIKLMTVLIQYLYTSFLNGCCTVSKSVIPPFGVFNMLPLFFQGSSFVHFLLLLP